MKKLLSIILLLFVSFTSVGVVFSQTEAIDKEIAELTNKIAELNKQQKTLSSQITFMNSQMQLTTLKIVQTQEEIKQLTTKIGRLEVSLDQLAVIVGKRIAATYKVSDIDPMTIFFSSRNFADFTDRYKYLRVIQAHDKKLLYAMETTRTNYDEQKQVVEALNKKLESQKQLLAKQKLDKENLLVATKNDEKKYQQLLAQAQAEKAALEQALIAGTKVGPIKRGDPIALVGNTGYPGCSTGKHLHFEIRKNNSWTDPTAFLQSKAVVDDQNNNGNISVGGGSWPWPINDTIRITQLYGHTPYSWRYKYSGGIHTGIDMVTSSTDVIRAPADGTLYRSSQLCGSSTINIVYIDHGDNLISFYLHVQ